MKEHEPQLIGVCCPCCHCVWGPDFPDCPCPCCGTKSMAEKHKAKLAEMKEPHEEHKKRGRPPKEHK